MDREAFFAALQRRDSGVFGTRLTSGQKQGLTADIDEAVRRAVPLKQFAAILAEDHHETGGKMMPVVENLNYTSAARIRAVWPKRFTTDAAARPYVRSPEKLANFVYGGRNGNTAPGDGWRHRGRGKSQITLKDNYAKFGIADDPDRALDLATATFILFEGILKGMFTSRKLSDFVSGAKADYAGSRATVNADVETNGPKIAATAKAFEKALVAAGYGAPAADVVAADPTPAIVPTVRTDKTTVEVVQRKLFDLGYTEVGSRDPKTGSFDGIFGKMTKTAILAFRNENGLPVVDAIDDELLQALDTAPARKLARSDATAGEVRAAAPEVQASFRTKIAAGIASAGSLILAAFDGIVGHLGDAKAYVDPLKDYAADVPGWVWLVVIGSIAFGLYSVAAHGEKKGIEAYQSGERR